jgi:hypothetical protein
VSEQYGFDTFNTFYAEGEQEYQLTPGWKLNLGAQFTDQRAVGDALIRNASSTDWATNHGGMRIQAHWDDDLVLTVAFSITGAGNDIQTPWGAAPSYLALMDQDFNRAREKGVLVGAAYDASKTLVAGLSGNFNFAWGWDAINASTRAKAPNQAEYDFTVDYRPPWLVPVLRGMWLRARAAVLDQENGKTTGYQFRIIINWDRNLI